ncbi:MAG: RnfABCDGE type electron transport complex subunit D [Gammaproteobacteria bacterium]|nr:RnfABCDGE type electron transport complex subunit D [Gammaproteobacteria bacterium]
MIRFDPISGPHSHSGLSTRQVMVAVMLALLPATLFALALFGLPALTTFAACCCGAISAELLGCKLRGQSLRQAGDGSALLTGWLLALSLPPSCPPVIAALGGAFGVLLAKQVYGGLGHNLFNPAMAARVMLLISFPVAMTQWPAPDTAFAHWLLSEAPYLTVDGLTGATPLAHDAAIASAPAASQWPLLLGVHGGSLGETSALLLGLGGLWLVIRRQIPTDLPVAVLIGALLPAAIAHLLAPTDYPSPLFELASGGLMLCAFFISTDPVTSPVTSKGRWIYGLGTGLLIWLIRRYGNTPEGVAFAVLLMNALTPLIDHWMPMRPFGSSALPRQKT